MTNINRNEDGTLKKGSQLWKKRQRHGRLGYGLEQQKKRLIEKSLLISENALDEEETALVKKEKIEKAFAVSLKELGKNIDITSGGKSINHYDQEQIKAIADRVRDNG